MASVAGSESSEESTNDRRLSFEADFVQLEYILEYVARDKELSLPSQPLHDLLSLVCDDASRPEIMPVYLLAAGCRAIFSMDLENTYFEEAMAGLEHLDQLEGIRNNHARILVQSGASGARRKNLEKFDRETTKLFEFTCLALRRWILIHEVELTPFEHFNCIALINILFPAGSLGNIAKERAASMRMLSGVKKCVKDGDPVSACKDLTSYKSGSPWSNTYRALEKYLEMANSFISGVDQVMDPVPADLKEMGIRRDQCVLHRISRHIIATDPNGYNPHDATSLQASQISARDSSPEL